MKKIVSGFAISIACVFFLSTFAGAAQIDITNGGMEITGPTTMRLHNVLANPGYHYVDFEWNSKKNLWVAVAYGLEETSFTVSDYFPLLQGSTWTYQTSGGAPMTLTVDGTETICGIDSIRLDSSEGSHTYWISDETGISMTRYVFPDGSYNEWCTPLKMSPAQSYLGAQSLEPMTGVIGSPYGPFGTLTGWTQFVVKSVEDVTVPAGTFSNCYRTTFTLTYTESSSGGNGIRIEETWFAKDVGMVKRINVETFVVGGFVYNNSAETFRLESFAISE